MFHEWRIVKTIHVEPSKAYSGLVGGVSVCTRGKNHGLNAEADRMEANVQTDDKQRRGSSDVRRRRIRTKISNYSSEHARWSSENCFVSILSCHYLHFIFMPRLGGAYCFRHVRSQRKSVDWGTMRPALGGAYECHAHISSFN